MSRSLADLNLFSQNLQTAHLLGAIVARRKLFFLHLEMALIRLGLSAWDGVEALEIVGRTLAMGVAARAYAGGGKAWPARVSPGDLDGVPDCEGDLTLGEGSWESHLDLGGDCEIGGDPGL